MKAHNVLDGALGALAAHNELIQEAYERGGVRRSQENARAITVLHQYRILVADGPENYHLSRVLSRFLDEITQKQRLFEALGDNIQALDERIYQLKAEFASAAREGRTDDMDLIAANFQDACTDLSDAVSSSLARLLVQAESRFGAVGAVAAKIRQNEHFLRQAEKISSALSALARSQDISWDIHDGNPLYEELVYSYRRLISRRMGEWNSELLRVTSILKSFLFRLRLIDPGVKSLRDFADFLHRNPGYEPPDLTELRILPGWLQRDPGRSLRTHPDVHDDAMGLDLEALAKKLPAPKVTVPRHRTAGTLSKPAGSVAKVRLVAPPHLLEMRRFVSAAIQSDTPISARGWNQSQAGALGLSDELWLFLVMQAGESQIPPFTRAVFRRVEFRGQAPISKNIYLRDIHVHRR